MSSKEAARLKAWVERLDRQDRLVVLLHWADDLTPEEIEQVLDLPKMSMADRLAGLHRQAEQVLSQGSPRPAEQPHPL